MVLGMVCVWVGALVLNITIRGGRPGARFGRAFLPPVLMVARKPLSRISVGQRDRFETLLSRFVARADAHGANVGPSSSHWRLFGPQISARPSLRTQAAFQRHPHRRLNKVVIVEMLDQIAIQVPSRSLPIGGGTAWRLSPSVLIVWLA